MFERLAYYKEFHDLAKTNDTFATDMGRYLLFMKQREPTPRKGGDNTTDAANPRETHWPLGNGRLTCGGRGGLDQDMGGEDASGDASVVFDPFVNNLAWKHERCGECLDSAITFGSGFWRSTSTDQTVHHGEDSGDSEDMGNAEEGDSAVGLSLSALVHRRRTVELRL